MEYEIKNSIYSNKLAQEKDIKDFILEGSGGFRFDGSSMCMYNELDTRLGQKANFVLWCPETFPSDIEINWEFSPIAEPGLAIMFFSALGINGEDIFHESILKRNGEYDKYHSGDINCYHISYFRRMWESERCFHTCNLRKSAGFHLAAQGADPLPDVEDSSGFYSMRIAKLGGDIALYINDLPIFEYHDDGETFGKVLGQGKIGFRQMAPLNARYKNLVVNEISMLHPAK